MMVRNVVIGMLFVTVIAPIVLYTDRLGTFNSFSSTGELPINLFFFFFFFCFFFFFFFFFFFALKSYMESCIAASNEFVEDVTAFVSQFFFFWVHFLVRMKFSR